MSRLKRTPLHSAVAALLLAAALGSCVKLPSLDEALANAKKVPETSKIFAADGTFITGLHAEQNRENVPLDQMPKAMRDAVISIEDERFYEHAGVDLRAIMRAFFKNTSKGHVVEGGSTITQQYVKNVLIERQKTLKRKITEAALAYQLEKRYSKDKILELYLNTVYFGQGAYGIETAAKAFFNTHAKDLTLVQCALLAGLIKSPARYDPFTALKLATERRNLVLERMRVLGYITAVQEAGERGKPLGVKRASKTERYPAPYFVDWITQMIQHDPRFDVLGTTLNDRINSLFKGGLRIYTTVDLALQGYAEAAQHAVLTEPKDPYNALASVDPDTGAVKVLAGGRDYFDEKNPVSHVNLATGGLTGRQPGSSFKPFTLAAALERGISLSKVYNGSATTIKLGNGVYWSPKNYESLQYGASVTLREATIKSINVVYAQVVRDIGPDAVVEMAHRLGITSKLDAVYAIALGVEEVSPLEMAIAYSAFANGGYRVQPQGITKITDSSGKVIWQWKPSKTRVLSSAVVEKVNKTLGDVVRYGTGRRQQFADGRPQGGKTGTAENYHDAWFAGYVRQLVAVSWVGFPQGQIQMYPPYTRIRVVGGSWPGKIWKLFMESALKDVPQADFPIGGDDPNTITVSIDVSRGCLPNRFTPPNLIQEVQYERGREPTRVCTEPTSAVPVQVPRVIGRTEEDARQVLEAAGLTVRVVKDICDTYPPGYVCAQSPGPGETSQTGSRATITVASEGKTVSVPQVLGMDRGSAINALRGAGLSVDYQFKQNESATTGCRDPAVTASDRVWLQTRCAGELVKSGTKVVVYVNP